jgi:methyltransferase (TIGR00027 family)
MSSDASRKVVLASSAYWIAAIRAYESEHANRLFTDPWAALLAGQARQDWSNHLLVQGDKAGMAVVIRTRFFDNFLLRAVEEHQIRQIVVLAAGMDTRAFRLVWPEGTKLFELDQPELLAQKERLLSSAGASSTCWRQTLGIDLRDPWVDALCQAGFDPLQLSVWLLEGFLHYLSFNSILHLIDTITSLSASESQLGFNVINSEMLTSSNACGFPPWMNQRLSWLSVDGLRPSSRLEKRARTLAAGQIPSLLVRFLVFHVDSWLRQPACQTNSVKENML